MRIRIVRVGEFDWSNFVLQLWCTYKSFVFAQHHHESPYINLTLKKIVLKHWNETVQFNTNSPQIHKIVKYLQIGMRICWIITYH